MVLLPSINFTHESSASWVWNGEYLKTASPVPRTNAVTQRVVTLSVPGHPLELANPRVVNALEHLTPDQASKVNSKGSSWALSNDGLEAAAASVWMKIVQSKVPINSIAALSSESCMLPYKDLNGKSQWHPSSTSFYLQAEMLLFVSLELLCWQPQHAEREVARRQKICARIWALTSFVLLGEFLTISQQRFQAHRHVASAVVLVSPSAQLPSRKPDVQSVGSRNAHTRRIFSTAVLTKAPTIARVATFLSSASFAYTKTIRQTGGQQCSPSTSIHPHCPKFGDGEYPSWCEWSKAQKGDAQTFSAASSSKRARRT